MLTKLEILHWDDVEPFLAQFDALDTDGSGRLDKSDLMRLVSQHTPFSLPVMTWRVMTWHAMTWQLLAAFLAKTDHVIGSLEEDLSDAQVTYSFF